MVMTSVSGHLLNLEFTSSYRGWRQCSPLALFDAPVQTYCPENYKDIKRTLEKEIRGCQGAENRLDGEFMFGRRTVIQNSLKLRRSLAPS